MDTTDHVRTIKENTKTDTETAVPTVQTKDWTIGYDREDTVLDNVSIGSSKGKTIGLMGSNGTGKSTLASTLTGLQKPLSGSILWEGRPISSKGLIKKSFLVMQDTNYQLFSDSVSE